MSDRESQLIERLVALASGELAAAEADQVEASIRGDASAQAALDDLRTLIGALRADTAPAVSAESLERLVALYRAPAGSRLLDRWIEQVRRLVLDLVFDSHGPMAAAGLRRGGEGPTRQLAFETGDVRLDIQIKPQPDQSATWVIRGQAASPTGGYGEVAAVPPGSNVPVAVAFCDERGRFRLTVPAGEFDVLVALTHDPLVLSARVKAGSS